MKNYTIAVAGTGYVGLSIATLLSQHHQVTAVDVIPEKVEKINNRISPIQDEYIEKYLAEKDLNLKATLDGAAAYKNADFVVIAAPTNYDPVKNYFDTSHVEEVIDLVLEVNPDAVMVIKSTIPVGYCRSLYVKYAKVFRDTPALQGKKFNLLFSPEFLRESKALYDNLYPSRIIVGYPKQIEGRDDENEAIRAIAGEHLEEKAREFARLLQEGAIKQGRGYAVYGPEGSGSGEAVCQYVSGAACVVLQRAGYVCGSEGTGYTGHHSGYLSGSAYRYALQQSFIWLRRLLSAEGYKAAAGQLSGCAGESDSGNRGKQPYAQGFHRGSGAEDGGLL